jgi:hypothetical protein
VSEPTTDSGQDGLFADSRTEIAADDWEDQDLLTKDEARLRLRQSAEILKAQLAGLGPDGDPGQSAELRTQLDRIDKVLQNLGN